jgi:hypothetical protein
MAVDHWVVTRWDGYLKPLVVVETPEALTLSEGR